MLITSGKSRTISVTALTMRSEHGMNESNWNVGNILSRNWCFGSSPSHLWHWWEALGCTLWLPRSSLQPPPAFSDIMIIWWACRYIYYDEVSVRFWLLFTFFSWLNIFLIQFFNLFLNLTSERANSWKWKIFSRLVSTQWSSLVHVPSGDSDNHLGR